MRRAIKVSCYVNKLSFGKAARYSKVGCWLLGETSLWLEGWEFSSYLSTSRWVVRLEIFSHPWPMIYSRVLMFRASKNPQKDRVLRASRLGNTWRFRQNGMLKDQGSSIHLPNNLPYTSLSSRCLSVAFVISFYNKLETIIILFSWVLWATLAN